MLLTLSTKRTNRLYSYQKPTTDIYTFKKALTAQSLVNCFRLGKNFFRLYQFLFSKAKSFFKSNEKEIKNTLGLYQTR